MWLQQHWAQQSIAPGKAAMAQGGAVKGEGEGRRGEGSEREGRDLHFCALKKMGVGNGTSAWCNPSSIISEATLLFAQGWWKWEGLDEKAGLSLWMVTRSHTAPHAKLAWFGAAPLPASEWEWQEDLQVLWKLTVPPSLCPLYESILSHLDPPWS